MNAYTNTTMEPVSAAKSSFEKCSAASDEQLHDFRASSSKVDKIVSYPSSPTSPNDTSDMGILLPEGFQPGNYDVICGRGKGCAKSIGNQRFRVTIAMKKYAYVLAESKVDKSVVLDSVVRLVKEASPNGGFIRQDRTTGRWYRIPDSQARDKVGHCMRDLVQSHERQQRKKNARAMKSQQAKANGAKAPQMTPQVMPQAVNPDSVTSMKIQPIEVHSRASQVILSGALIEEIAPLQRPSSTTIDSIDHHKALPRISENFSESLLEALEGMLDILDNEDIAPLGDISSSIIATKPTPKAP